MFWAIILLLLIALEGIVLYFRTTDVVRAIDRLSDQIGAASRRLP